MLLLLPLLLPASLAAQVPPDTTWRTLDTEHFRVHFVAGLDTLARRAAARAEAAYAVLAEELPRVPRGRIELVLADNVDFANGSATPLPTNRIVVYAHPPVDTPELAFTTDWLQLVILHELVHIFHLDAAGGAWERLRSVFGRNPLLFPQLYSPRWVMEGLATYYESRLTPGGRVRGTLFDMALRTAILEDAFFPIDRATGDPVTWPAGSARYIYGGVFFDFLARRYGPEQVPAFVERYARQPLPYRVDRAARRAFGASFSSAWAEWRDSLRARYLAQAEELRRQGVTEPEILTREGRSASFPRYSPDGAALAYGAATGREEPATRVILPDGHVRTVAERTTLGPAVWDPGGRDLLFAQLDYVDPYRIYADLYRARIGGEEERLTRAARLWEPALHPNGRTVVAVTNRAGTNVLALHDLATGVTRAITAPSPDTFYSLPRWSPRGDRIAVSRMAPAGLYDVVVMDTSGMVLHQLTHDRALDVAPAWSPDGRYVVFASDRTGIPNLFAYDLEQRRLLQVTNVLTGATQPDVSPDGRWIAFAYYRSDGYHIARIPFDPTGWRPAPPVRSAAAPLEAVETFPPAGGAARPYSPWPSIAPATWSLRVEPAAALGVGGGLALYGEDAVERHRWSASALLYSDEARFEGGAAYHYRGWGNPVLDLSASQGWAVRDAAPRDREGNPIPSAILQRERELQASLLLLRRRWRSTTWLRPGGEISNFDFVWDDPGAVSGRGLRRFPLDLAATLQAGYSSARGFAYSLGPQQGVSAVTTVEGHRYLEPMEGQQEPSGYLRLTSRERGYHSFALPGFARHVLGLRLDLGLESGSRSPGFSIGGASGGGAPFGLDLELLGQGVGFPVRGYREGIQQGNRAVTASAEYRFPIVMVERGFRVLPLFLDRVWGDVFLDAGTAWCAGASCRGSADPFPLYSVGAELMVDLGFAYGLGLPVRLGAALPLRGPDASRPELYLRLGRSF